MIQYPMLYRSTRDLHLYAGLLVSPFLLLFAGSVFFLNHAKVAPAAWTRVQVFEGIDVPSGVASATGPDAVALAREVLRQIREDGEVGGPRFSAATGHFTFSIASPGAVSRVDADTAARTATLSQRRTDPWERLAYLHKMPGPHNVDIRGNWWPLRVWSRAADGTVYLTMFLTVSGVYLWWALRAERRVGLILLSTGLLTCAGFLYVLIG